MTQTTGGMSARALKVEYAVNTGGGFGSYADISGYAASVEPSGAERGIGEQHTGAGDTPIVTTGKLSAARAVLRAVYTQADSEAFDAILDAKVNNYPFKLRWSVPGGATGDKQYEIEGYVAKCTPPSGDTGSPDLVLFEAEIVGADFAESTVSA